ncbi:DUF6571 family protein [Streptomyces laurentii]|uniref:DUF6571 family protein n=1 Tax=Streptomyces laurentii TaxID=39478 RepID=UPI0036A4F89C
MLTFDDVVNAPVAKLKQAVDDWSTMVTKLEKLSEDARSGMQAKTDKAQWQGVNSEVTRPFITKTVKEFEDAEAEARGVKLLLADAHTSFKAAKDELVKIRDEEGPAAGIHVDAKGKVTPRHDLETDASARHDPDYQDALRKQKHDVTSWQRKIDRIIEDCADADDSLKRALAANVKDDHNFSAAKFKSLDAEQVDRAAELLKKITGEGGTARNVAELRAFEDLMDDNRDDPEFATAFFRKVGPEGTLDAYAEMALNSTSLGPAGQDRVDMVKNIQSDMGAMLGLATRSSTPNHLDAAWTTELLKAGRKELDLHSTGISQKVYGYQALSALIREGSYDKDFLVSVGRDMVAMDKKSPGIWSEASSMDLKMRMNLGEEGGKGFNPLTGLMEAMANNPEASAAFFDEPLREDTNKDGIVTREDGAAKGKDAQGIVDYMLDKKPEDDWYDAVGFREPSPEQEAMGNALEAAVTGRGPGEEDAPLVEHTKTMSSVMEKVVAKIGASPELVTGEGPLTGLAPTFGDMAAEYMPDLQAAAENGADQAKPLGKMAEFNKGEMAFFLGAVGQDPQAYGAITNAQQAYTTLLVSDVFQNPEKHGDPSDALRNAVHPGGEIAGIMTEARAQAIHDAKTQEAEDYNQGVADKAKWGNRLFDAIGGKYIDMIPVGGDVIGWIKEDVTESAVKSAEEDKTDEARRVSSQGYTAAEDAVKGSAERSVDAAARGVDLTPEQLREYKGAASIEAGTAHSVGRDLISSSKG